MALIHTLTSVCEQMYHAGDCAPCNHPCGSCSGGCINCADEVNFHREGRDTYNCPQLVNYYVCRYSWKYCSEIMYALELIDLDAYSKYNILSIGCGGAPDLMAFELSGGNKPIFYKGYDNNSYWDRVHGYIEKYCGSTGRMAVRFRNADIFSTLAQGKPCVRNYNVVVMEYLLSAFPDLCREDLVDMLFDGLIENVLPSRLSGSPFLILINDIDHYMVRDCYDLLPRKLEAAGYCERVRKFHFTQRKADYGDGSAMHPGDMNLFQIPERMKREFACPIPCTSSQLIIEVW